MPVEKIYNFFGLFADFGKIYDFYGKINESLGKMYQNTIHLYLNLACLFVCLYPKNIKTAEPIGPNFFVGSRVTPGKVYGWSNFQKFAFIKIRFLKILEIHENFFWKSAKFFVFIIC